MTFCKKSFVVILLTWLTFLSFAALATTQTASATNPIAWALDRPFQQPLFVGRPYTITYTLTNQLPIRLVHPLVITNIASPQTEFSYDDQCSGKTLAPKANCTVSITLTPVISGMKYYQLTIGGYDNNLVHLPELTALATGEVQEDVLGSATLSLPYSLNLGSLGSYQFTFTNYGQTTATITSATVTANGTTLNTPNYNCTQNLQLTPTSPSCTISGTYTPNTNTPSEPVVTATLKFTGASGNPATATTFTNVQSGQTGALVGTIVPNNYLPPLMTPNIAYPLQFLFTNASQATVLFAGSGVGSITCSANNGSSITDCPSLITSKTSNCSNNLPYTSPAAACQLTANFTAPSATSPVTTYTITASVPYTGQTISDNVTTIGTVVASLSTTRTVTLINQCNFPVWFSLNGAALAGYAPPSCPPGTSDGPSATCFWNNPTPISPSGNYQLASGGGTNKVTIDAYNYGDVQWSGNISASTLCTGSGSTGSCVQADCQNQGGTASCAVGQGFSQPATQAEITMNVNAADSYDVEVINGFHIPISMQPVYYQSGDTTIYANWNNYNCGTPGELTGQQEFGACNWKNATLPSPASGTGSSSGYYWVPIGGKSCDITSATDQCSTSTTGQLCGLSIDRSNNTLSPVCGEFLGYWSADQVCSYSGLSSTVNTFFNCKQALSSAFPTNSTLYDLMRCKVPSKDVNPLYNSCYLSYSGFTPDQINTCCGCVDWWNPAVTPSATILANSNTQSCGTQIDPEWTTNVQPMIQWMKQACPSAYTFPFDDKTSSFGCTNNLPTSPNSVGYIITFCEGGNTGLPTGISASKDGRIPAP